jgi:23S rRNA pseudouridine1911/1915/1917 synthase
MKLKFKILFEDPHLLVLSKPAGLLSQGEHTGQDNLVDELRKYWGRPYVGLIHRLDRNTSGLMVVAKRTKAANRLTAELQKGSLKRSYRAWVWTSDPQNPLPLSLPEGTLWKDLVLKNESTNQVRVVGLTSPGASNAKTAILKVSLVSSGMWKTHPVHLFEYNLETGRSHQIRVQSTHHGFPLVGDPKYGDNSDVASPKAWIDRVALHSYKMEFPHPMSKEILRYEEPLPKDMILPTS